MVKNHPLCGFASDIRIGNYLSLMPIYSPLEWSLILAAAFGDGFLLRTFGQGIGIILTPILTLAFAPRFALGLLAFYSSLASLGMARHVWRKWDRKTTIALLPGQLAGVLVGVWIVAVLPDAKLRWIIGLLCLSFALHRVYAELSGVTPKARRLPLWVGTVMGGASGLSSALANSGGVVLSLFLHSQNFHKTVLLATLWIMFFILNPFKVVAYWKTGILTTPTLLSGLVGVPVLWLGLRAGAWAHQRLPGRTFNLIILGIALAGSLRLLMGTS
jgi:uncharacterized membrane protein YfcA